MPKRNRESEKSHLEDAVFVGRQVRQLTMSMAEISSVLIQMQTKIDALMRKNAELSAKIEHIEREKA